jgi:serine phosphatase RsbU (regulator of sigma subunit)/anti-sigma regulatory factor (Ser/Thr protein kinase)
VAPVASIRRGLERIGRGDLDARLEPAGAAEFRMLCETLNSMSARLRVAQTEALERERLAGEMEIAATIQRSLLPAERFVSGGFVLAGAQRPAAEVGGDYFDFLTRSDGRLALVMADVSGKGVGGALMMSMLASTVRAFFPSSACASDLLVVIEKQLGPQLDRRSFITVWHGVLDPESGRVEHASAGHLPTLVVRARDGQTEWIRGRAVPIGISGPGGLRAQLESAETLLEPGDLLVQLTDGVTEAFDPGRREQFGFDRVEAVVRRHAHEGPDAVVKAIFEAVSAWTCGAPQDDETVLVVWRDPAAADRLVPTPHSVDDVMGLVESFGVHLRMPAEIPQLAGLRGWLLEQPAFAAMPADHRQRVELALYELAANAAEHGYRRHEEGALDLWWIADEPAAAPPSPERAAAGAGPDGFFVLRDHGRPFDPGRGLAPDFGDPATRRQGRGLGLALARRLATRIRYYPNTTYGNLTLLRIEPQRNPEVGDVG